MFPGTHSENAAPVAALRSSPRSAGAEVAAPPITCRSAIMAELLRSAEQAGRSDLKVLITGESGVGKDLVARHVAFHSGRVNRPFVAVNCAGFTETLLESELFGHVRGSFTGAYRDKPGQLELAHQGTLFLDEVGDMSLRMQALLLRFLEHGEIQPVGALRPRTGLDVRIVSATNRDLPLRVAAGEFREDLLYRLRVIHLHVPPLRERHDDIDALVEHFCARAGRNVTVSREGLRVLHAHHWPGNVRELQNVIEQAIWQYGGSVIVPDHLRAVLGSMTAHAPERERRRQLADELFTAITAGGYSFWADIYPLFIQRDLTRDDLRGLVRRGLARTHGNYRAVVQLFGMPAEDYKRFVNFLAAHDCSVDFRGFRHGEPVESRRESPLDAARASFPSTSVSERTARGTPD